ncbi:hypothetical protein [Pantoea sp. Nvir]|nr:hypothetical protein [Pantoea sp. Nvir]
MKYGINVADISLKWLTMKWSQICLLGNIVFREKGGMENVYI